MLAVYIMVSDLRSKLAYVLYGSRSLAYRRDAL